MRRGYGYSGALGGSFGHNSIGNALSPTGTVATWRIGGDGPPNKVPPKQKPRDGEEAQFLRRRP